MVYIGAWGIGYGTWLVEKAEQNLPMTQTIVFVSSTVRPQDEL
jgi:hypothetical protein